jgi:hypothetical protein
VRALPAIEDQNERLLQSICGAIPRDETVVALATRSITRERSCDGKKAFRTPAFAAQVRDDMQARHGAEFHSYFCPFCSQYHVASGPA